MRIVCKNTSKLVFKTDFLCKLLCRIIKKIMKIKLFTIPIENIGDFDDELNSFLSNNRIITMEKHFVERENGVFWCFYISYESKNNASKDTYKNNSDKVDYRALLPEEQAKLYDILRIARKKISQDDSISAFVVATNEELYYIAQLDKFTLTDLKKTKGFGDKKAEKYGKRLLDGLSAHIDNKKETVKETDKNQ